MKPIFASLILALLAISATGKDRHCIFRVHVEANPNDTAIFSSSVRALFSGKQVAIERMPRLSERDVVAFYPYPAADGNYGALFQLDDHGQLALDALSIERRGICFLYSSTAVRSPNCRSTAAFPMDGSTSLPA